MVPKGWQETSIGSHLVNSKLRNKDGIFNHDNLRAVNKRLGMIPMKDRVKGKSVDRAKLVKKDWFAYNPMRINIGSICRWKGETDCIVSPDYVVFHCDPQTLDTNYFDQFRRSHRWKKFMDDAGRGSVRIRIYLETLKQLKCILPPLEEQKIIATTLSTWDQAIEATEKLTENSERQKTALMQKLLTKKVRLPDFSNDWAETTIANTCSVFSGGTPSRRNPKYYNGNISWIKSGELNKGDVFETNEKISILGLQNSSAKIVKPNTLLIALYGATAGIVGFSRIEAAINQAILAIEPNKNVSSSFLYFYLQLKFENLKKLTQGGQPNLNSKIIKNLKIQLPSIEEQEAIAEALDSAEQIIKSHLANLEKLKLEKASLMQQLLTGKRRIKIDGEIAA